MGLYGRVILQMRSKVENQHRKISGYRELSQTEIELMNEIKAKGNELGKLIEKLELFRAPRSPIQDQNDPETDMRWVSIGKTHLQQGIMALVRAVAKPESF